MSDSTDAKIMAKNVAVLGGGSFGTAIANILADNGHRVRMYSRNAENAAAINRDHVNAEYLPDYALNESLYATSDLAESVQDADVVFVAIPSKASRKVAQDLRPLLADGCMVLSTTKGIESDGFKMMSEVLKEELPQARIGVISGPNLAKEIAARQIAATVVASEHEEVRETVQALLKSSYFRAYSGSDVYGVELAGALKNVYAIVSGMAAALGVGTNSMAMLLTRSLAEMTRFAAAKGAEPMTFMGLAGIGDLYATCTSPLSRNYRVGFALGEGRDLKEVVEELGQVAEGVNTIAILKAQADEMGVYMPLVQGIYEVIYEEKSIDEVIARAMSAEQNKDVEFSVNE